MHSKYGFNAGKRLESDYYYDFNPFCALDSPRNLSLCSHRATMETIERAWTNIKICYKWRLQAGKSTITWI